jgi:hypothetical protein
VLAAPYLTKSLSCNIVVLIKDAIYFIVFIIEQCFKMFKEDSVQIQTQRSRIPSFRLDGPVMRRTPISIKKPINSKLHPFERHGNTSRHTSKFKKIPAFLYRHRVRRQLAPVRTPRQYRPDAEILDKEVACIQSTSI